MQYIYLDNAATTKPHKFVIDEMIKYSFEEYGNPSSVHRIGIEASKILSDVRSTIAKSLNSNESEIYFTSGATESDNWAIIGLANSYSHKGRHVVTSKIEHSAVLSSCKFLEENGFEVSYVPVDEKGVLDVEELKNAIREDTILISVMYANNEVGSIQPIKEIGSIAKEKNIVLHCDATQGYCKYDIDVNALNISSLSASAHKIYGPKGIGFLYIRDDLKIDKFMHGGHQERSMRGGTHNTPAIAGMGKAIEYYQENAKQIRSKEVQLRDYLLNNLKSSIPNIRINGDIKNRLNNNLSISLKNIDNSKLRIFLDMQGICVSGGSACSSGDVKNSHVLDAMYGKDKDYNGAIRMTVSINNTIEELDKTIATIKDYVKKKSS